VAKHVMRVDLMCSRLIGFSMQCGLGCFGSSICRNGGVGGKISVVVAGLRETFLWHSSV